MLDKPEIGKRLRVILNQVFGRALAYGLIQEQSSRSGHQRGATTTRERCRAHEIPTLSGSGGGAWSRWLPQDSFLSSRAAYRFMVLTAARTIEVRRAVWSQR